MKTSPKPRRAAAPKRATPATRTRKPPGRAKTPAAARPSRGKVPPRRADFGAPIDGFFAKQPSHLREILHALRELVEEAAPDATAALKWGMPNFAIGGAMMCAMAGFKSHVNLIVMGPPAAFADPEGLLEGEGKGGRHLKLRTLDELPREAARGWLRAAAQLARKKGAGS